MALKQPNKVRVELGDLEHGGHDYDGNTLLYHNNQLYTGYVVYDRHPNGLIEYEEESKNGSRLGWINEYADNGQLIDSTLTVGLTQIECYQYNLDGTLKEHWLITDPESHAKYVQKYNLD